ncbi:MAG: UTP--glucose-1-phosphate uridylyltransferase [Candidatus Kerfeldbacteria bacterium]|nr:UTP--glucose-1-phosphate uridylyltransferase [Candidatus Kerfeldbacteria bacterium]
MPKSKTTSPIKKVVIPAAGLGTRFLPATKAMPKEMLPVVDKPVVQYVVEEAVAAGAEDIIIVTGANKRAIEDHFDTSDDLIERLKQSGKEQQAVEVQRISSMANFIYVRQKGPYGNGTPVLNARHLVNGGPFAVIWGDDLVIGKTPRLQELIEVYKKYGDPVLTAYEVGREDTKSYGIIDGLEVEPNVFQVKTIVEKPGPDNTPSTLAALGGYILTPDIFEAFGRTKPGKDGELWLVDAIFALSQQRPIYARRTSGTYHDVGSKLGWLRANLELGLDHPDFGPTLKKIIHDIT